MGAMEIVLWVCVLLLLLRLAEPTPAMRRDPTANGPVYAVWAAMFGRVVLVHWTYMAAHGLGGIAIGVDAATVVAYLLARRLFRRTGGA